MVLPGVWSVVFNQPTFYTCLRTCPEEQCKLTRIMHQHTPRTTRRRSSEQTRTVCTDGNQMVWRPMLGILARGLGRTPFEVASCIAGITQRCRLLATRNAGCRVEAKLGAPERCPGSFVGKRSDLWKSSNNFCAMGLETLTRRRSCATSRRRQRTWQCGHESVCDTWVVLSFRDSRFSSVWSVVAT